MEKWSIGKSALLTDLGMCINHYRLQTVGLYACIRVEVQLGDQLIVPDMIVMINAGKRKQCEPDYDKDIFIGPPNFVMDIQESTSSAIGKERKQLLEKAGVEEYFVVNDALTKIEWNRLAGNRYKRIKPDKDGLIKSTSLPGLWMPIDALKKRDFWAIMAAIDHGITRRDHHDMMESIWNKDQS